MSIDLREIYKSIADARKGFIARTIIISVLIIVVAIWLGSELKNRGLSALLSEKSLYALLGLISLLGTDVRRFYKTIVNDYNNKLNRIGAENLLRLHFGAVTNKLMYGFERVLDGNIEKSPKAIAGFCITQIEQVREHLHYFHIPGNSTLFDTLKSGLPREKLTRIIEAQIMPILLDDTLQRHVMGNRIYQVIQREQTNMLVQVMAYLFHADVETSSLESH